MAEKDVLVEVLFPEVANLGGDAGNVRYLRACMPQATFVETHLADVPRFAADDPKPDLVILANMTERNQERALERLMPHKDALVAVGESGGRVLFTGSAAELLGEKIVCEDGSEISCLGVFDFVTRRRGVSERYNGLFVGRRKDTDLLGWKSQFTMAYGDNSDCAFCEVERGIGINPESKLEGFERDGIVATWLLGPLLVCNPDLTRALLDGIGATDAALAYEDLAREAYARRMPEMRDPKRGAR